MGLSAILHVARAKGTLVYLSGSGADETISDYAIDGTPIFEHSCFQGRFPQELETPGFFPWCSFNKGTQRNYFMKEELVTGAHGIEGRYPFLDPKVVQEYLWLTPELKNSEYKRPVADYLRAHGFPNAWRQKIGFNVNGPRRRQYAPAPAALLPNASFANCTPQRKMEVLPSQAETLAPRQGQDSGAPPSMPITAALEGLHVVVATDRIHFVGLAALLNSLLKVPAGGQAWGNSSVAVTVLVPPKDLQLALQLVRCVRRQQGPGATAIARPAATWWHVRVNPFAGSPLLDQQGRSAAWLANKGNLAARSNFARFYLPDLLPTDAKFALYVDADVVFTCDVLTKLLLRAVAIFARSPRAIIAAVPMRAGNRAFVEPSRITRRYLERVLGPLSASDYRAYFDQPSFNAGLFLAHLPRWRAANSTQTLESLLSDHAHVLLRNPGAARGRLPKLDTPWVAGRPSSQSPMLIVFAAHRTVWLPRTWNSAASDGHSIDPIYHAGRALGGPRLLNGSLNVSGCEFCAWHWAGGKKKPWLARAEDLDCPARWTPASCGASRAMRPSCVWHHFAVLQCVPPAAGVGRRLSTMAALSGAHARANAIVRQPATPAEGTTRAITWTFSGNRSSEYMAALVRSVASVLASQPRDYALLVLLWDSPVRQCSDMGLAINCTLLPPTRATATSEPCSLGKPHLQPGVLYLVDARQAVGAAGAAQLVAFIQAVPIVLGGTHRINRQDLYAMAMVNNLRFVLDRLLLGLGVRQALYLDCDTCVGEGDLKTLFASNWSAPLVVAAREAHGLKASWNAWNHMESARLERLRLDWGFDRRVHQFNAGVLLLNTLPYCIHGFFSRMVEVAHYLIRTRVLAGARLNGFNQAFVELAAAAVAHRVGQRWNCRGATRGTKRSACAIVHEARQVACGFCRHRYPTRAQ